MEFKDYYKILGVTPETPVDEIKRAYRKLARKYHPDVSKLPDAEKQFKEVNEAWEVLQDSQKRAQYDQIRAGGNRAQREYTGGNAQGFSGQENVDFSDFFNSIFGGGQNPFAEQMHGGQRGAFRSKGQDLHAKIQIPLTSAYEGGVQTIQLQGEETKLNVKIPAGVTHGSKIRLKGQGSPGMGGGEPGDLYVEIHIMHHPFYSLHHKDIHLNLPIAPWEAALGTTLEVPTLGGKVNLKIAPGSQSTQKLRLKGRGLPGSPAGDQFVILEIMAPKAENEKAIALYKEMATVMLFNPREKLGV